VRTGKIRKKQVITYFVHCRRLEERASADLEEGLQCSKITKCDVKASQVHIQAPISGTERRDSQGKRPEDDKKGGGRGGGVPRGASEDLFPSPAEKNLKGNREAKGGHKDIFMRLRRRSEEMKGELSTKVREKRND